VKWLLLDRDKRATKQWVGGQTRHLCATYTAIADLRAPKEKMS